MAAAKNVDPRHVRRALVIGIDLYCPEAMGGLTSSHSVQSATGRLSNLGGAVNDARALVEVLQSPFGFHRDGILLLENQHASRAAILRSIDQHLIAAARPGAEALFYFAGHGSQTASSTEDSLFGRDETLVPADSCHGSPDIRDKELRHRMNRVLDQGARLTMILDSCHSGSAARGLPSGAHIRAVPADLRQAAPAPFNPGPPLEDRGAMILSATQEDQPAWEAYDEGMRLRGAFSLALLRALRLATKDEPVERTFLRARALLQAERARQEPVLAGQGHRLQAPLFGTRSDRHEDGAIAVVADLCQQGRIRLHGGWASGLSVGSSLRSLDRVAGSSSSLLRIVELEGLSRSVACFDLEAPPSAPSAPDSPEPKVGELYLQDGWAAPPGVPLRLWIPTVRITMEELVPQLAQVAAIARRASLRWITSPQDGSLTHLLRYDDAGWNLHVVQPEYRLLEQLGPGLDFEKLQRVLGNLGGHSRDRQQLALFVQAPATSDVAAGLGATLFDGAHAIDRVEQPEGAHYHLVGRFASGQIDFAWLRPDASLEALRNDPMPPSSAWFPWDEVRERAPAWVQGSPAPPRSLPGAAYSLARVHSWLSLESPIDDDFPYSLELHEMSDGGPQIRPDGLRSSTVSVVEGERYGLVLRTDDGQPPATAPRRFVYVFLLDSDGASQLIFPPPSFGNVECRLPRKPATDEGLRAEIFLGERSVVRIGPPFGVDSYVMLTTEDALASPSVLEFDGVRRQGKATTPLEQLLIQIGNGERGAVLVAPAKWSITRLTVRSESR